MTIAVTAAIIAVALLLIYLYLVAPRFARRPFTPMRLIAHRGLFDPKKGRPENSLSAFDAACAGGYAIELDVQITADNVAVVFHDDELQRMCGAPRDIMAQRHGELAKLTLDNTAEHIPTFAEVLALVDGRVPLLVELKHNPRRRELVQSAMALLDGYEGAYVVESFDPWVLRELKRTWPNVIRGQLVGANGGLRSSLLYNILSRPDFVAYDVKMARSATIKIQRKLFRTPLAVWTLKDYAQLEAEKHRASMLIFDGFKP